MASCTADAPVGVRLANVVAIISHDTYRSVLPYAVACASPAGSSLTIFTYVPMLFTRAYGAMVGYAFDDAKLAAEVREVELAADALLPRDRSVRFVGGGFKPGRDCLSLIRATRPDVVVTSERHALMLLRVRTASRGRCAVLMTRRSLPG